MAHLPSKNFGRLDSSKIVTLSLLKLKQALKKYFYKNIKFYLTKKINNETQKLKKLRRLLVSRNGFLNIQINMKHRNCAVCLDPFSFIS